MLVISTASAGGVRYWQRSAVHCMWLGEGALRLGLSGSEADGRALSDLLEGRLPGGGPLTNRPGARRRQGWDLVFAAPKSVSLLAAGGESAEDGASSPLRLAYRQAVADAFSLLEQRAAFVSWHGHRLPAGTVACGFEHVSNEAGQPHLHTHLVLANLGHVDLGRRALGGRDLGRDTGGRGTKKGGPGRSGPEDAHWGCLVGSELWRWREGIGAGFQLALRARLSESGLPFEWEIGPGGLGEVVGVAPHIRAATSGRSLATRAGAIWFGSSSAGASRVSQGKGRQPAGRTHERAAPAGTPLVGRGASRSAGLPPPPPSRAAVERALAEQRSFFTEPDVLVALAETSPAGHRVSEAIAWASNWCEASVPLPARAKRWTTDLARHFDRQVTEAAVLGRLAHWAEVAPLLGCQELAALGQEGAPAQAALQLACSGSAIEVLPRGPWLAQAACIDAARAAWQAAGMSVHVAAPSETSERRWRALTSLQPAAHAAPAGQRGRPGRRVLVVDAADHIGPAALARLVAQARATETKLVLVPGGTVPGGRESMAASLDELLAELPAERTLPFSAGLDRAGVGSPLEGSPLDHSTGARGPGKKLMTVAGKEPLSSETGAVSGTKTDDSGLRRSTVVSFPHAWPAPLTASTPPAPATAVWGQPALRSEVAGAVNEATAVPGLLVRGAFTGRDALAHTVSAWLSATEAGVPALMVALGAPEAEALNLAARHALKEARGGAFWGTAPAAGAAWSGAPPPGGRSAEVLLGERNYALGERVMALRRIGSVRAGTRGRVVGVAAGELTVEWQPPQGHERGAPPSRAEPQYAGAGGHGYASPPRSTTRLTLGREHAGDIGYGYATTVPYLRTCEAGERLFVLGDPVHLAGRTLADVKAAWVTVAGPGMPAVGQAGAAERWRSGVAELAAGWPDERLLLLAGERPLRGTARERWERRVADCALLRAYGLDDARQLASAHELEKVKREPAYGLPGTGEARRREAPDRLSQGVRAPGAGGLRF